MQNHNKEVANILKTAYHWKAPINGNFPQVVYARLSSAPVRHADNKLYGYRVVYRITIIDKIERLDLAETIRHAMEDAGWMWENGTAQDNDNECYTVQDFSKLGEENHE